MIGALRRGLGRLRSWIVTGYTVAGMHLSRIILMSVASAGTVIGLDMLGILTALAPEVAPLIVLGGLALGFVRREWARARGDRVLTRFRGWLVTGSRQTWAHLGSLVLLAALNAGMTLGYDTAGVLVAFVPELLPLLLVSAAVVTLIRRGRTRLGHG